MSPEKMLKRAKDLSEVLQQYVYGKITRKKFSKRFPGILKKYEETIDDSAYYPLDILVPTADNSDRAWKENMLSMYRNEIARLESLLEHNEPSYSETLSDQKLIEHCKEALERLPVEILDRTTKAWLEENIVNDVFFEFLDSKDISKFGYHEVIYQTPIEHESFLLSALNGKLRQCHISYPNLLQTLEDLSDSQRATWVQCSEPDGAIAAIEISSSFTDAYKDFDQFNWIEQTSGDSVQWGTCYLILLPEDKSWMLANINTFREFKIELHGNQQFVESVIEKMKISKGEAS